MPKLPLSLLSRFFTTAAASAFCGISLFASETVPATSPESARAIFTMLDDNDFFGDWSDKYYTNHTRLALTLEPGAPEGFYFFSFGQEIYTPKDRAAEIPDRYDHPYAGYIYASLGSAINDANFALSMEIQLGATGDWSLAEQIQKEYHRIIAEIRPAGWDTQIHHRIVGQALGDVRWRFMLDGACGNGGFGTDLLVHGCGDFGNLRGIASAGTQLRAGWNLPKDFGQFSARHSTSVTFAPKVDRSLYAFLDVQGDAILWDKTLTGNNGSGADITAYPFAAQFTLGVCAIYDRWMLSVFQSARTKDFTTQDHDFFLYGGFRLSVFF